MPVCEKCGKPIVWAITEDGARIPLDPKPSVYVLEKFVTRGGQNYPKVRRMQNPKGYVSHFVTCPEADHFSGRNQKRKGDPNQPRLIT